MQTGLSSQNRVKFPSIAMECLILNFKALKMLNVMKKHNGSSKNYAFE